MNNTDFNKLRDAVRKVLGFMVKEGLRQLQVSHKTLHTLAKLTNTRSRSLLNHVDDILTLDEIVRGGYGVYFVADAGVLDGESQMVFIKQNTGVHSLVVGADDSLSHKA